MLTQPRGKSEDIKERLETDTQWARYYNVLFTEILIGLGFAVLLLCLFLINGAT